MPDKLLPPPDPIKNGILRERYRDVFLNSREGREVLKNVLFELGYFHAGVSDAGAVAKRNYAARLVAIIGPDSSDLMAETMLESLAINREVKKKEE